MTDSPTTDDTMDTHEPAAQRQADDARPCVTRFAPSPTGHLHLGHAYSAMFAYDTAQRLDGRFLLRIEDIDTTRCRPEFEESILDDLAWLGLEWETPVRRQSEHMKSYARALKQLAEMDLLYPCFCTRKEIEAEINNAIHAPHPQSDGSHPPVYPGICRKLGRQARSNRFAEDAPYALRLDTFKAMVLAEDKMGSAFSWMDAEAGKVICDPSALGDVVLARKETPTSYHLACVIDDHAQGVTHVTRGKDLFDATHIHCLLQVLLDLDRPQYHHHDLVTDASGKRLAKRDGASTLKALRESGKSAADVREMAHP